MTLRRVLVLHGYSQNAAMFHKRMSVIRKSCENLVEFVFIDAPHVLVPADLPGHSLEWLQAAEANAVHTDDSLTPSDTLTPRGWWKTNPEKTVCYGLQESLMSLRDALRGTTFQAGEGVLGFSQGAALAVVVAAILERPDTYEPFKVDGQPIHPKLEFVMSISGFLPSDPFLQPILSPSSPKLATPSVHVIGDNDVIVVPDRSQILVDVCATEKVRVERHEGGHFVPSKSNWRKFFKEYLTNPDAKRHIMSPSELASAAPLL